jgi:hypothetical protein
MSWQVWWRERKVGSRAERDSQRKLPEGARRQARATRAVGFLAFEALRKAGRNEGDWQAGRRKGWVGGSSVFFIFIFILILIVRRDKTAEVAENTERRE